MLQEGFFVADVAYYYGDHVPNFVRRKEDDPARVQPHYDYDVVNEEVLLTRMSVKNGRLTLPDGMSYRALVLPGLKNISLPVLRKIRELTDAGAMVIGPKPERTASLTEFPGSEQELKSLAERLWDHGKIISNKSVKDALAEAGLQPDASWDPAPGNRLDWIHRRIGETDFYFVANLTAKAVDLPMTFRIAGRQPEWWDPVTGTAKDLVSLQFLKDGRTQVPLHFEPYGSGFLIFRKKINEQGTDKLAHSFPTVSAFQHLQGPWHVSFNPKWGPFTANANGKAGEFVFESLEDWTRRTEEAIRFYSGTAVYRKTFSLSRAQLSKGGVAIDLGQVHDMARVRLNGVDLGVVWCPPWRVDISKAAREGENALEIEVVNQWANRLIGDAGRPVEERYTKTNVSKFDKPPKNGGAHVLRPSGLLGPVRLLGL
jgi:hypothetical protein